MAVPYQIFVVYGSLVSLVYLATDGFKNNAPFVFTLPPCTLGLMAFSTHMPNRKKISTAVSFFLMAAALYQWSENPKKMELTAILICIAHITYLFSFFRSIRRWWFGLAMFTALLMSGFVYSIFADLYRSLPILIALLCFTLFTCSFSFICAGSVWKYGSTKPYEERPSLLRFVGMFFLLICNAALLSNQFGRHTSHVIVYLHLSYFTSLFLLYFSNERAF